MARRFGVRLAAATALSMALAVGVAACGGDDDSSSSGGETSADAGTEPIKTGVLLFGKANDESWNTSMADSVERVKDELNLDVVSELESVTAADGARAMRQVIEQGGAELVILHASALDQATKEVAAEHPEVCFLQAFGTGDPPANVTYYVDNATGVNYLAGIAAASQSESGKIGVVGGIDLDEIVVSVDAFEQGAKSQNPDSEVLVTWVGDFEDPLKGKEAGLAQIAQGADVLYAYGDGTGLGTVEGASEKDVPLIGAWFDQYSLAPELMITSFVSDWAPIITDTVEKMRTEGAEACGQGVWAADLANGGALLAPFHDFEDKIPDEVKTKIDDARTAIIDGELDPVTGKAPADATE